MEWILELSAGALDVFVALAPFLLLGFFVAGVLHAAMPPTLLARWLGTPGFGSVTRAALLGVPLPLCSCSVIPVAVELRRSGASRGATASFLVSTPETGIDSISASVAVLHPLVVVLRPVAALLTATTAGLLVESLATPGNGPAAEDGAVAAGSPSGCCHAGTDRDDGEPEGSEAGNAEPETAGTTSGADVRAAPPHAPAGPTPGSVGFLPDRGAAGRFRAAMKHAFVDLFGDIAPWLVPAVILTAVLTTLIEPQALGNLVEPTWLQMVVMLVVGIPVYVCATAATPVAAGMIAAGFSPGAALVFLLVGPATNAVTLRAAAQTLGMRGAWAYGTSVAVVSILCGLGLDAVLDAAGIAPEAVAHIEHDHAAGWPGILAAAVLAALTVWHLGRRWVWRPRAAGGGGECCGS